MASKRPETHSREATRQVLDARYRQTSVRLGMGENQSLERKRALRTHSLKEGSLGGANVLHARGAGTTRIPTQANFRNPAAPVTR